MQASYTGESNFLKSENEKLKEENKRLLDENEDLKYKHSSVGSFLPTKCFLVFFFNIILFELQVFILHITHVKNVLHKNSLT